jgi:hypothetical protein
MNEEQLELHNNRPSWDLFNYGIAVFVALFASIALLFKRKSAFYFYGISSKYWSMEHDECIRSILFYLNSFYWDCYYGLLPVVCDPKAGCRRGGIIPIYLSNAA